MNSSIKIDHDRRAFAPGEQITGRVSWSLDQLPTGVEVRLCWFTRGKGTSDMEVISKSDIESPLESDERPFAFEAPRDPWSFSGKLISLIWSIELILNPGHHCDHLEIVIAPDATEIILPTASQRESEVLGKPGSGFGISIGN